MSKRILLIYPDVEGKELLIRKLVEANYFLNISSATEEIKPEELQGIDIVVVGGRFYSDILPLVRSIGMQTVPYVALITMARIKAKQIVELFRDLNAADVLIEYQPSPQDIIAAIRKVLRKSETEGPYARYARENE